MVVPSKFNPWKVLGLKRSAKKRDRKVAYWKQCTVPDRQQRSMASLAYLAITSLNHPCRVVTASYLQWTDTEHEQVEVRDHIFVAVACGNATRVLEYLRDGEVTVDSVDDMGCSLLYLAARCGFYDLTEVLLRHGAPITRVQSDGSTALHAAAFYGHHLVTQLLLSYGIPTTVQNRFSNTAAEEARTTAVRDAISASAGDAVESLAASLVAEGLGLQVRLLKHEGVVIAKEIRRDPRIMDSKTRGTWPEVQATWKLVWHGTKLKYITSILRTGLRAAGTVVDGGKLKPPSNHYQLGDTHFGVKNWAAAIFVSPRWVAICCDTCQF